LRGQLKLFAQPNRGPGAARNLGAMHAEGRYLAFLDSDDLWFPWTLDVYREIIERTAGPSFIAGKPHVFLEPSDLPTVRPDGAQFEEFDDYFCSGDRWRWWGVSSFVIRRDSFFGSGGFTEERVNGEDADLALRLGIARGFVHVLSPATFAYRDHGAGETRDFDRTLKGAWLHIKAEKRGAYPGGRKRAKERWRILTRHCRPVTLRCLREGLRMQAWALYLSTFSWHVFIGAARYLLGFPFVFVSEEMRRFKRVLFSWTP